MPRELITIQVGQCGNQIGMRFWDLALKEHANASKKDLYDDSLSSFFRNCDNGGRPLPIDSEIQNLKARVILKFIKAVVVDMEEGVIAQVLKSHLGELFEDRQFVNDVSGAGNNWAQGHFYYGNKYKDVLFEKFRKAAEECDSLQCFFLMHSLGGGTGSGLGTYILKMLEDDFPNVFRFSASVFPSNNDDVITSPYNSMFSLNELIQHADCVFPIENNALMSIVNKLENLKTKEEVKKGSKITDSNQKEKAFDKMNNIIAHLLSNLTSSMRFEGILNVDLNEITMNLVPYPDLHFLTSGLSPLYTISNSKLQPRRLDQMFTDCYSPDYQLISCNPKQHRYLAMGLLVRGPVTFSDVNRNIKKMKDELNMIYWNKEGFKYGICNTPPIGLPYSLLSLANNTCIQNSFSNILSRVSLLYKRKAHVHHYTEFTDLDHFDSSIERINSLNDEYKRLEGIQPKEKIKRISVLL